MELVTSQLHAHRTQIAALWQPLLDFLLPPRCQGCGTRTLDNDRFCSSCWGALSLSGGSCCSVCDLPFDFEEVAIPGDQSVESDTVCAACTARPPTFDWAVTAALYDDASKGHILRLKHARATALAKPIGQLMAARLQASGRVSEDKQWLLVPVPLHIKRYRKRRFNQSLILAKAAAKALSDTPFELAPDALERPIETPSQAGLSRMGRWRNLKGAIAVSPKWRDRLKGRSVLIVDDVFTTGATAETAAKAVKKAGVNEVGVVCFARTPGPR